MTEENPKKKEEKSKGVEEIVRLASDLAKNTIKKKLETVLSAKKDAKGWKMVIEVLERKAVPDTQDILGRYEFVMDSKGKVLGFKQVMLRHRSETRIEDDEEEG